MTPTRRRYLARHPSAEVYAGFGDFGFWLLDIDDAHGIVGFGRIREVPGADVILAGPTTAMPAADEAAIVGMVNRRLANSTPTAGLSWCIATGADPEGIDFRRSTGPVRKPMDMQIEGIETRAEAIVYEMTGQRPALP